MSNASIQSLAKEVATLLRDNPELAPGPGSASNSATPTMNAVLESARKAQIAQQKAMQAPLSALPTTRNAFLEGYLAEKARLETTKTSNSEEGPDASEQAGTGSDKKQNELLIPMVIGVVLALLMKDKKKEGGNNNDNSGGLDEGFGDDLQQPTSDAKDRLSATSLSEKEKEELAQGEQLINEFRAKNGRTAAERAPIKLNAAQCLKAKRWSETMANGIGLEHSNFGLRENIAYGAGIVGTIQMWINSPGHHANLLGSRGEIGLGKSSHGNFWTMIDGRDTGGSGIDPSNIA